MPSYKMVFIASGIGMLISLLWFFVGRAQLKGIGAAFPGTGGSGRVIAVLVGCVFAVPVIYFVLGGALARYVADALMSLGWLHPVHVQGVLNYEKTLAAATVLAWILGAIFIALSVMLLVEGVRNGKVARDKVIAMLIIFAFNVLFWMFFEQAGSSFTFLADEIVNRQSGDWTFPTAWFQSVNSLAIITLAPVIAWIWVKAGRFNPSISRKFALGLGFNGLAFPLLMFALSSLVNDAGKIPFWTLFMVYVIQTVGELCLSPIGLSMTTTIIAWIIGNLIGLLAGFRKNKTSSKVLEAIAICIYPIPYFILALVLQIVFGYVLGWFPLQATIQYNNGLLPFLGTLIRSSILPGLSILLLGTGWWIISMKSLSSTTAEEDFVLYARYRGLSEKKIGTNYVFRNSILTQITALAMSLGGVFNGSIMTEIIFGYPGVGTLIQGAIMQSDYNMILGCITISIVAIATATLIADLIYPFIDPRIRYS
jgi:ABC-type dipeptide/oligopeptide/nickel transport system permease component